MALNGIFSSLEAKLSEAVRKLAVSRLALTAAQDTQSRAQARLESSMLWKDLEQARAAVAQAVASEQAASEEARRLAIKQNERTGHKRPHPAVLVTDNTTLEYDKDEALKWAIEHSQWGALSLNASGFKKLALAHSHTGHPLVFVSITVEKGTRIDRDLSKYLPPDDELPF